MASPFPGMDPYLEAHWRDIHARLIVYLGDALRGVLPSSLRIRVEQRAVSATASEEHGIYPDAAVLERRPELYRTREVAGLAVAEPLLLDAEPEEITEGYLEISEKGRRDHVVTAIEVLSPSNKTPGPDMQKYKAKQRKVCGSDTNLVEIDLLRGGSHVVAVPAGHIRPERRTPYLICVRRATAKLTAEVYPIALHLPLPAIAIPLRPTDPDVPVALQPLIERCSDWYEAGDLDYSTDPDPPLSIADAAWIDQLLREKGFRQTEAAPAAPEPKKKARARKRP